MPEQSNDVFRSVEQKALDTPQALMNLKDQLPQEEVDHYLQTPPEFFREDFDMNDFVDWLFKAVDISEFTEEALAELPEGQFHQAYETTYHNGERIVILDPDTNSPKPKFDPETGEPVPTYKGHLKNTWGWANGLKAAMANVVAVKTGVRIPEGRYDEFIIAYKPKLNQVLKSMGREDAMVEEGHSKFGGFRKALETAFPVKADEEKERARVERAEKLKEEAKKADEAELAALKKQVEEKEFQALGERKAMAMTGKSIRERERAQQKQDQEVRNMIGRYKGTPEERAAMRAEAQDAGLRDSREEHRRKNTAERIRADEAMEQRAKEAKKAARKANRNGK